MYTRWIFFVIFLVGVTAPAFAESSSGHAMGIKHGIPMMLKYADIANGAWEPVGVSGVVYVKDWSVTAITYLYPIGVLLIFLLYSANKNDRLLSVCLFGLSGAIMSVYGHLLHSETVMLSIQFLSLTPLVVLMGIFRIKNIHPPHYVFGFKKNNYILQYKTILFHLGSISIGLYVGSLQSFLIQRFGISDADTQGFGILFVITLLFLFLAILVYGRR